MEYIVSKIKTGTTDDINEITEFAKAHNDVILLDVIKNYKNRKIDFYLINYLISLGYPAYKAKELVSKYNTKTCARCFGKFSESQMSSDPDSVVCDCCYGILSNV